jgi:Cu2+-exporting ATPase
VPDLVAQELGIGIVFAQVLPEDRASRIRELQDNGEQVDMAGPGAHTAS